MKDSFTINDKDFAAYLIATAFMCADRGTDNCDIVLTTKKGKIRCHLEFEDVEDQDDDEL